jgi:hypothetical protein
LGRHAKYRGVKKRLLGVCLLLGCSHVALSGSDLDRVAHPAFISRVDEGAGPESLVFGRDDHYRPKLGKLDDAEADRRLRLKLAKGVTRFEISDRLRADTLALLPKERPWTQVVDPASVASALESFLVEEVPAREPNYGLLRQLGADAIVEFVVQDYGMRSNDGRAGAFVKGYARMFLLDGSEMWRATFDRDALEEGLAPLDPLMVAQKPQLFGDQLDKLLDEVAVVFSKELSPTGRRGGAPLKPGTGELQSAPDDVHKAGKAETPKTPELPDGELPPP